MLYKLRDIMRLIVTVLVILESVGVAVNLKKDSKKGAPCATTAPCLEKNNKLIDKSISLVYRDS